MPYNHGLDPSGEFAHAGPLAGIRVLSVEDGLALPLATQLMADLGAEVISVNSRLGGSAAADDPWAVAIRQRADLARQRTGRGKTHVEVDLARPEGAALIRRAVGGFDVFAQNAVDGPELSGLGYEDLTAAAPTLVYLSVSPFGLASPYLGRPATTTTMEAMAGLYGLGLDNADDQPTVNTPGSFGDACTAIFAAIGVFAGLSIVERTGVGTHIDLSIFDSTFAMNDGGVTMWSMGAPRERLSGRGAGIKANFKAKDGHFTIVVIREHMWARFATFLGQTHWIEDSRFALPSSWTEATEIEVRPVVEEWAKDKTKFEAALELAAAGIVAGPCLLPDDLLRNEHVTERHLFRRVLQGGASTSAYSVDSPMRFSEYPPRSDAEINAVPAGMSASEFADFAGVTAEPDRQAR